SVPVVVQRGGAERTLDVTIGSPEEQKVASNNNREPAQPKAQGKLGVSIANASDPDVRKQLELKGDPQGAVVVEVVPGSPASDAGLRPGDIIERLDGKKINTAEQLTDAARSLRDGATVPVAVRRGDQ